MQKFKLALGDINQKMFSFWIRWRHIPPTNIGISARIWCFRETYKILKDIVLVWELICGCSITRTQPSKIRKTTNGACCLEIRKKSSSIPQKITWMKATWLPTYFKSLLFASFEQKQFLRKSELFETQSFKSVWRNVIFPRRGKAWKLEAMRWKNYYEAS